MIRNFTSALLVAAASMLGGTTAGVATAAPPAIEFAAGKVSRSDDGSVTAGPAGAVYLLASDCTVKLAPNARVQFGSLSRVTLSANQQTMSRNIHVRSGTVEAIVPQRKRIPCAVTLVGGKAMVAVATGGRASMMVTGKSTTVAAFEGSLVVGTGSGWRPLAEGYARTVSKQDRAGAPRPILQAPKLQVASPFMLAARRGPNRGRVTWDAVPGAARYVTILSRQGREHERVATSETSAEFGSLQPGTYSVAVRAFDPHGLPGALSEPRTIRVVGIKLPRGAYLGKDGAAYLGERQRVSFVGAEGLRVTYDRANYFIPIPDSVGLNRGRAVVVRLREPGTAGELRVRLEPKLARAAIAVSPSKPRWPGKPVKVTVRLYDGTGNPARGHAEIVSRVRLNERPLQLDWKRKGGTLTAHVPAAPHPGPWNLSVNVSKRGKKLLARSNFRIAEAGPGHD